MLDQYGRRIDYLRISITDRCNLHCRYCTPDTAECARQEDTLSYDEMLRICRAAVRLGITKFKVTGGEPLVRAGCAEFISALKAQPGTQEVTLTTNGLLLEKNLDALAAAGVDGVNVSLDTPDEARYARLTGCTAQGAGDVMRAIDACCRRGIRTKVNAVLLPETYGDAVSLASIAARLPVDVRFIELMPIGHGAGMARVSPDEVLIELRRVWADLTPTDERRGNGPAHYYASAALSGRIGFIDAVSHKFCAGCNRARLTGTGQLKPCLCYDTAADLRALLRGGAADDALLSAMERTIFNKPRAHCFDTGAPVTERHIMSQIGG